MPKCEGLNHSCCVLAGIGVAVPALLPKAYTHYAAALLFAYFGYKLLREVRNVFFVASV